MEQALLKKVFILYLSHQLSVQEALNKTDTRSAFKSRLKVLLVFISGSSKKAKEICKTNDTYMSWVKNHITHFPHDAEYLNVASFEINHENAQPELVPIDEIHATFSPLKHHETELVSSDIENDQLLRDREIRGSKRHRDLSQELDKVHISQGINEP